MERCKTNKFGAYSFNLSVGKELINNSKKNTNMT